MDETKEFDVEVVDGFAERRKKKAQQRKDYKQQNDSLFGNKNAESKKDDDKPSELEKMLSFGEGFDKKEDKSKLKLNQETIDQSNSVFGDSSTKFKLEAFGSESSKKGDKADDTNPF